MNRISEEVLDMNEAEQWREASSEGRFADAYPVGRGIETLRRRGSYPPTTGRPEVFEQDARGSEGESCATEEEEGEILCHLLTGHKPSKWRCQFVTGDR